MADTDSLCPLFHSNFGFRSPFLPRLAGFGAVLDVSAADSPERRSSRRQSSRLNWPGVSVGAIRPPCCFTGLALRATPKEPISEKHRVKFAKEYRFSNVAIEIILPVRRINRLSANCGPPRLKNHTSPIPFSGAKYTKAVSKATGSGRAAAQA
jgi:hypothetical protein